MLIEIQQAIFGYRDRAVVRVEKLHLHAGRCLGVFGPNGAGKTTLVRGLVGLLKPFSGSIIRKSDLRFGYLPQHRTMDLNWPMTGLDAASMAISARKRFGWMGSNTNQVRDAMKALGVADLAHQPFARLSGGQQQRLLLAGSLAADPEVLVLDEPTDGLDVRSRRLLLDLLREQTAAGVSTVMISHEVEDLLHLADEVAWLHPGDDPTDPSHVEVIAPTQLAERVTHAKRVVS